MWSARANAEQGTEQLARTATATQSRAEREGSGRQIDLMPLETAGGAPPHPGATGAASREATNEKQKGSLNTLREQQISYPSVKP